MKTIFSICLLLICSVAAATEPQPMFGLDCQDQVCENGVCYYPSQVVNNNFGLGSRILANRAIRRATAPQPMLFGLPVARQTIIQPQAVQTSSCGPVINCGDPVNTCGSSTVTRGVVQYSEPIIIQRTYQPQIVSQPVTYQANGCGCVDCNCGMMQMTTLDTGYANQVAFRHQVQQRRYARRQAWANRPGLFGWRLRSGRCY